MDILSAVIIGIVGLWITGSEYRFRNVMKKIDGKVSEKDVKLLLEPSKVIQSELKEDIRRLEHKIDILIESQLKR